MAKLPTHTWLPYWLSVLNPGEDVASHKGLKTVLATHGVHAGGLRIYVAQGDRLFAALGSRWISREQPERSARSALALLRLLQDAQITVAPPVGLIQAVANCCSTLQVFEQFPVALFRAAWRETVAALETGLTLQQAVEQKIAPILCWALSDWLRNTPDANQIKGGWKRIRLRYEAFVAERTCPNGKKEWPPLFGNARFGELYFMPLTNQSALADEGEQMQHCLADYFEPRSLGETHQAFSVREPFTFERLATLALVREGGVWSIEELKAFQNGEPSAQVLAATKALVAWLNRRQQRPVSKLSASN